ncbi:alanine racemase [Nitrospira sp. Kam-Ns4a]
MPDPLVAPPHAFLPALPPTRAVIDLSALRHNLEQVRRRLAASCGILAVVKADGYGHGAVMVARTLVQAGVAGLGVSTLAEGVALREAAVTAPVLVLGALLPHQYPDLVAYRLTPVIHDRVTAVRLADYLAAKGLVYPVHIKVETGMGRLGLDPHEVLPLLQSDAFAKTLRLEGIMTHLADADGEDAGYTEEQVARFRAVVDRLAATGLSVPLIHVANTAAILRYPAAHFTAVRPGIMLYGYHTLSAAPADVDLRPVLTLAATVVQVREIKAGDSVSYNRQFVAPRASRIAVLPIGYADGYSRALSNRGTVLVRGRRVPVCGRVCMDMTMVDVTEVPEVMPGDEAVLIGRQGDETISALDLAGWLGTIPYEVLCGIGLRVPRLYLHESPEPVHPALSTGFGSPIMSLPDEASRRS